MSLEQNRITSGATSWRDLAAALLTIALLGLAACAGNGDNAAPVGTETPAPTPTETPVPCPLPEPFCGGDFPLNTEMPTQYGPAWADVSLGSDGFFPCFGHYALCFYANCTVGPNGASACPCFDWYGTSYVEVNGILNLDSYLATVGACSNPSNCQTPNSAPVCDDINSGSFLPSAKNFSTFSFYRAKQEPLGNTDCTGSNRSPYAGCMTAPCFGPITPGDDPHTAMITCDCPLYDGPYQIGKTLDASACDDQPMAWSAAYRVGTTPSNPCDLVPSCVPDAPADECGCPLLQSGQTLPPDSGVDCGEVCNEYATCTRDSLQLGFTCDATLCTSSDHDLVLDACDGLEKCELKEIFKAETAGSCSCCASQLCGCDTNAATDTRVFELDAAQRTDGDTPQCDINGTLCGTAP